MARSLKTGQIFTGTLAGQDPFNKLFIAVSSLFRSPLVFAPAGSRLPPLSRPFTDRELPASRPAERRGWAYADMSRRSAASSVECELSLITAGSDVGIPCLFAPPQPDAHLVEASMGPVWNLRSIVWVLE
ncbi:hypothetical protein KM043_016521 [Ampulex compressa]|nr:hypothetical protein KM043_016521 [Ampulex compressa]